MAMSVAAGQNNWPMSAVPVKFWRSSISPARKPDRGAAVVMLRSLSTVRRGASRRRGPERGRYLPAMRGVPSAMIGPPARITTRSASFSASPRSCVVSTTVASTCARRCADFVEQIRDDLQ